MRVDDGPAVLPERYCGQVVEPGNDVSLPVSAVHVSLSQAGDRRLADHTPSARPLIPLQVLSASCVLAALCLYRVWFCFLETDAASLFYSPGLPTARQFAALLIDNLLLTGIFVALWQLTRGIRRFRAGQLSVDMAFLLFLAVPANAFRAVFQPLTAKLNLEYWRHASVHGLAPALRLSVSGGLVLLLAAMLYIPPSTGALRVPDVDLSVPARAIHGG